MNRIRKIFICAIENEALPFIRIYNLIKIGRYKHITIYENDDIVLLLSGAGMDYAMMTLFYAYDKYDLKNNADCEVINFGTCGSIVDEIGEIHEIGIFYKASFCIKKLPYDSKYNQYDPCHVNDAKENGKVIFSYDDFIDTVDIEKKQRYGNYLADMEAYSLKSFANFANIKFRCLKLVSDFIGRKKNMDEFLTTFEKLELGEFDNKIKALIDCESM